MVIGIYDYDEYNDEHRTENNVYEDDYNCAGYALGTFNWYLPYDEEVRANVDDLIDDDRYNVDYFTDYLLDHFEDLRVIDYPSQAKDNEEVIGMRVDTEDYDFHFIRRKLNKKWYHKVGWSAIHPFKEDIFNETWCNRYNSEIVFFAKKIKKQKFDPMKMTVDKLTFM